MATGTTDKKKVMLGKPKIGGAIFSAPLGTALPTSETTALPEAWQSYGYASEDGVVIERSSDYDTFNAWGGDEVAKSRTSTSRGAKFTLIEANNAAVAKIIFGEDNVTVTAATTTTGTKLAIMDKADDLPHRSWVVDMKYGDALRRLVIPDGQVNNEDLETTYADGELIAYPVELSIYRDESGVFMYEYVDDGLKGNS